jgi:hypothetical protein
MKAITSQELSARMSKRLANFKLPDSVIKRLSDRVVLEGLDIGRFNPCIYGICIDYFTPRAPDLSRLFGQPDVASVEVFIYGIINPELFHVHVGFQVDEMEGKMAGYQA